MFKNLDLKLEKKNDCIFFSFVDDVCMWYINFLIIILEEKIYLI